MDIGPPRRIIEIEPVSLPLPDLVPDPAPEPAAPAEPAPAEPPTTPEPVQPDP
jgi:hypothetical protein